MKSWLILSLCLLGAGLPALAQPGAAPKTYTYLIYHKLNPGLSVQDALPVEREWKTMNQATVNEGNLIGWHMMVKQFTSNPNPTEYDYVTCIVSPTMALKGASSAAMATIYGDSVQARMASLQKRDRQTAPVVKIEIWENLDALFGSDFSPGKTGTVVVDFLKLRDPVADWEPAVALLKQVSTEQIARKQLGGWSFSRLLVPNGSEKGYGFAVARPVTSLSILADISDPKLARQLARTFEVVRQDVFRFEQFTIRPAATK